MIVKKSIFIFLCITSLSHPMEQKSQQTINICKWDAKLYAQNNNIQETTALQFLSESNIDITKKFVLDVASGAGNISKIMAETAKNVYGIDACPNMIAWAKKQYNDTNNLSFHQCCAEDFANINLKFDVATLFHCVHWFEDKPKAFRNIAQCLKRNGDLLCNVVTESNTQPLNLQIFREMIPGLPTALAWLKSINVMDAIGSSYPTDLEYKTMINQAGFTIISFEKKLITITLKDRDAVAAVQKPIVMSRPLAQILPETLCEWLFKKFIDKMLEKLVKDDDGNYLLPLEWTVVHARKK